IKGNRRNISPHHRCIPHVYWILNTGYNNFGPITIIVVYCTNLLDQFHTYVPPVVQPPDKWAYVSAASLCRQKRLIRGETKSYVGFNALFGQSFYSLQTIFY